MKFDKKWLWGTTIVTLLPMAAGLLLWNRLPDTMATHWGINGEPDGYSSKAFAVIGLPLFLAVLHGVCIWATMSGKARVRVGAQLLNYAKAAQPISPKMAQLTLMICPAVSLLCGGITLSHALGTPMDVSRIMALFIGALFTLVGNYLPKTRRNGVVGIKLPWTLESDDNWNRTHRFAGPLWMGCGLAVLLCGIIGAGYPLIFAAIAAMVLLPGVYSYALHRQAK